MSLALNRQKPGHVYLFKCISCKEDKWLECSHKIGYTTQDIEKRKRQVESQIKGIVEVVDYFWTEDPFREESVIHATMAEYRFYKEWFDIPSDLVSKKERKHWFVSDGKGLIWVASSKPVVEKPKNIPVDFNITEADARRITEIVAEESQKSSEISRRNIVKSLLAFAKSEMSPEEYAKVKRQYQ